MARPAEESPALFDQFGIKRLFVTGMAMGAADIVPGVSGGTIAFIMGVYQPLIEAIRTASSQSLSCLLKGQLKDAIQAIPWKFLLPVFSGILLSVISLAQVLDYLLTHYPVYIWSVFLGLILASVKIVSHQVKHWHLPVWTAVVAGTGFSYWLAGVIPAQTPANLVLFFLSGMVAIMAMILPGISGSFILLILGKYQQILSAVVERDFMVLAAVAGGAAIGLALFAKLLSWLFRHYHDLTVGLLTGFMLGSLRKVWPWKEVVQYRLNSHGQMEPLVTRNLWPELDLETGLALGLIILSAALVWYLESRGEQKSLVSN